MRCEFHPEALAEFKEAAVFYLGRQPGLDQRFIDCVQGAITRMATAPESFPRFEGDVRRCLTRVFPYGILFTIEPNYLLVVAVMHCSREPGYWRNRTTKNDAA
ncbi:MAG: type II toxin-antitoxin system RelE/ParE family toxin [Opitutaceae bacterium]